MADQWMYRVVGAEFGPVPQDELQQLLQEGLVSDDDDVRPVDKSAWRPANSYSELGFQVASGNTSTATVERTADDWYCKTFGTELGPLGFDELKRMAENGEISADDEVRLGTRAKWRRVGSIGRLMTLLPYQEVKREVIRKPAPVVNRDTSVGNGTASLPVVAETPAKRTGTGPAPVTVNEAWYASIKGVQYGPVGLELLVGWIKTGQLSSQDFVRQGPQGEFQSVSSIPELAPPPPSRPAPAAPRPVAPQPAEEKPVSFAAAEPAAPQAVPAPYASSFSSAHSSPAPSAPAWGNSSAGFGAAAPAFSRPAPAPARKSKSSSSSSGGGMSMPSIDFGALFKNPAVLGVLAVLALAGVWFVLPASQGADIAIYKTQKEWLTAMQAAEKDKSFASLSGKYDKDAKEMATDLGKRLSSSSPHRKFLMWNAKYRLAEVVSGDPVKSAQAVKDFEANLKQAAQFLRISE
jgi:hypothetical protein